MAPEKHAGSDVSLLAEVKQDFESKDIPAIRMPAADDHYLMGLVETVSHDMKLGQMPHVFFHSGKPTENFAHPYDKVILLSEQLPELFSKDEIKVIIAHELDHLEQQEKKHKMQIHMERACDESQVPERKAHMRRLNEQRGGVIDPYAPVRLTGHINRFWRWYEASADDAASKIYGREHVESVLKKCTLFRVQEVPRDRALLFPELDSEALKTLSTDQLRDRIDEIAKREITPADNRNLWRLRRVVRDEQEQTRNGGNGTAALSV